ncbi:hypothetical protein BGAL_0474g00030 [Botrytis galanthina]|uniref:Cytochrome P450 alkane hydroxylase n=1 Tax=Botrytis galanthina TaxID=278940 RepID=A0A4S8QPE5_9HELO|nr:hypothetical protein BGAL_0474g00030 [Botrytis galanthina]
MEKHLKSSTLTICHDPFCGRGFITTDGDTWRKARALLRSTFSKSNILDPSAYKVAVEQFLQNIPDDGCTTVDLQPLLANLYLETSLIFLIGISPDTRNEDERKKATEFIKAFNVSMIGMGLSFVMGPFRFLIPKSLTTGAHKQVYDYIDVLIDKTLEKTREKPDYKDNSNAPLQKSLLEGLAKQTDDRIEIRQNVIQGMMAAQDEVQYLDLEASSQLFDHHVFLQNILRESLRIYPVFPIMNHIALRDTVLPRGGGTIGKSPIFAPKGTTMYTNQHALHHEEKVFGSDVESFKPDRWDSVNCKPTSWEYMPFGGEPRACVGQQKALVQAAYTVAKIAQVYKD